VRTLITEKANHTTPLENFNKFLTELEKSRAGYRTKLVHLKKYMQDIKVCNCQMIK
jgi:hypothetical protein